jgi:enoyl-CoA hydratase/carnithine racemase
VRLEVRDRIAYLTLERPEALNSIDESVLAAFPDVLTRIRDDSRVKAMVITGAGDAFSVGLDIDLLGRAFGDVSYFRDVVERLKAILLDIEALPVPVIAAVNGLARAGGFELILASDIVLIANEARIGDTHVAFGIIPGGGASARAPRRLGIQRAREILLTGRWLRGPEAAAYGLAARAVPRAQLDDEVERTVAQLRPLSRAALAATKALLNETAELPLREALAVELDRFEAFLRTPTAREGYQAFVDKRRPDWG